MCALVFIRKIGFRMIRNPTATHGRLIAALQNAQLLEVIFLRVELQSLYNLSICLCLMSSLTEGVSVREALLHAPLRYTLLRPLLCWSALKLTPGSAGCKLGGQLVKNIWLRGSGVHIDKISSTTCSHYR